MSTIFDSHSVFLPDTTGYYIDNNIDARTHIDFVRGGYRTVFSSSDIPNISFERLDEGQIIYALHESKTYIITKFNAFIDPNPETPGEPYYANSHSYAEFYYPSNVEAEGVGFPYSGSDNQFGTPAQAIITGSLLLSGSGNITASNLTLNKSLNVAGNLIVNKFGPVEVGGLDVSDDLIVDGDSEFFGDVSIFNSALQVDSGLQVGGNADVDGNLDVGGTLSFDGFTFSDGNISILSGSNIFGTSSLNTHQFTGSLLLTGSANISGDLSVSGDTILSGSNQITGSLDILGDLLIGGIALDFSGIADQIIFVANIMINTGDFQEHNGTPVADHSGNLTLKQGIPLNNQFAISSSETPGVQLAPGDKVKIDWTFEGVNYSHTTNIFTIKETDSNTALGFPYQSFTEKFNWLSSYNEAGINPNANPPYEVDYGKFDYAANSSMSLHTGITASHWKEKVKEVTSQYFSANSANAGDPEFDDPGIINTSWNIDQPYEHGSAPFIHQTFKLYKIIPGVPCCNVFGNDITVHGGITTVDGPIRADGELIAEQGVTVKVPDNPNFHDPTKYIKGTDKSIATVRSGSVIPIEINDQGIFKMHNFTQADEDANYPTPQAGGIIFRNGEMYLGKE
tara:strand:- start:33 stop:1904 length:1872 start_codon:yes stop_codon:yes gene_type:complete